MKEWWDLESKDIYSEIDVPKKHWNSRKQYYVDEFLSLKCCGDILNVANPLGKNARKEITESMALIKRVKKVVLSRPWNFKVIDICAGNALTSLLACHLFHNVESIAFDKLARKRDWDKVRRFNYVFADIYDKFHLAYLKDIIDRDTIIVSSHPCGELARAIINIYKESKAKALFIMPCCDGKLKRKFPDFFRTKLGSYAIWCYDLALDINAQLTIDDKCISPKNIIVSHIRKGSQE